MDSEIIKSAKASTLTQILTTLYFGDINNKIFYECFTKAEGDFLENIVCCNNFISDESLLNDDIQNIVIEAKKHVIKTLIIDYMKKCIKENNLQAAFDSDNQDLIHDLVNDIYAFNDDEIIKSRYKSIDTNIFKESKNDVIKELLKDYYKERYKQQDLDWIEDGKIKNILMTKQDAKAKKSIFTNLFK